MLFLKKHKMLIIYGLSLAALLMLLKLAEYRLMIIDHSMEIYIGTIALLFTLLGIWLAMKLVSPKKEIRVIEKEKVIETQVFVPAPANFVLNQKVLEDAAISPRELEVLGLMAKGLSNQEIATVCMFL
jgi:hypothetical protein